MRTHGIEIEFLTATPADSNTNAHSYARHLNNAGVSAISTQHGGTDYTVWQVQPDGSLPSDRGAEIVSPRLTDDTFADLRKVCGVLEANQATVDKRCGLHVHFDARDLTVQQVCAIALAYDTVLSDINALLPPSRRAGASLWAVPAAGGLRDLPDIRDALARGAAGLPLDATDHRNVFGVPGMSTRYDNRRYRAVSLVRVLHAPRPNRTIEFRAHSGTVDFDKIKNWVLILDNLIEATLSKLAKVAATGTVAAAVPSSGNVPVGAHSINHRALPVGGQPGDAAGPALQRHQRAGQPRIVRGGTKVRQFIERAQAGTVTFEWCASELDWSRDTAQSWAAYVRAWGFPLKSIKMGIRVLGYTMESVAVVTTRLELNAGNAAEVLKHDLKAGLPADVVEYIDQRKAALAPASRLAAGIDALPGSVTTPRGRRPRRTT